MDTISITQASTTTLAASSAIWAALYSSVSARSVSASCYKEKIMKDHMLGLFLPAKLLCCTFNIFLLLYHCNQYGFMCFKGPSLSKTSFFTWAEEIKLEPRINLWFSMKMSCQLYSKFRRNKVTMNQSPDIHHSWYMHRPLQLKHTSSCCQTWICTAKLT